jgi:ferrochelatase
MHAMDVFDVTSCCVKPVRAGWDLREKALKLAIVVFNLGGPDSPEAVRPFLQNLFSDPAILSVPTLLRLPLAWLIARRRAPVARAIYARMGGSSTILAETEAQAAALEKAIGAKGVEGRVFIAMRAWKPFTEETLRNVSAWKPDHVILLPLYPQFSSTTSASSLAAWDAACARTGLDVPQNRVCCYPWQSGFVNAVTDLMRQAFAGRKEGLAYRVLFSAHGLPKRTILRGDPYQWQVERSVDSIVGALGEENLDWRVTYQSRVGPLEWIGPATDLEIEKAGAEGMGLVVVPVSFVSEHSETLVELDMEYAELASRSGVPDYIRVSTVRTHPAFIAGLAEMVMGAIGENGSANCKGARICPSGFGLCGWGRP